MDKIRPFILLIICMAVLMSFGLGEQVMVEFGYPKKAGTTINLTTREFKKFKKEWRGSDYYYLADAKNGMICSVLYYKLNADETRSLVDEPRKISAGPEISPIYPLSYFTKSSNLKASEVNNVQWGEATDDFMFRQNDIREIGGMKFNQKHMYGYAMVDKDLFVNIHLSKVECSEEDSTTMRQILGSLVWKKGDE